MDDLAKLAIKIDATDADTAAKLLDALTKSAKGTETSAALLMSGFSRLMVILGPAALAGAFAHSIKNAIELQDRYVRLSEVAGTTAAQISSLDLPARLSGTSLETVAQAIAKISRSIGEAQLGDAAKKGLFKALGIDPNSGNDATQNLIDVGKTIMEMQDKNVQAYASMQLLGRSFAELRPFLKELIEQGETHARVTDEQAKAAKHFEDQLTILHYTFETGKVVLANEYLPALTKIVDQMVRGQKEGGVFTAIIRGIQTLMTGDDAWKNTTKIYELTERRYELEERIKTLNKQTADRPGLAGINAVELHAAQRELAEVNSELATTVNYQRMLNDQAKDGAGSSRDGMDDKAIAGIVAEAKLRRMMEDQRLLEQRVALQKGFGERYAAAINTANALANEANKQGLMSDEELIRQLSANEKAKLQAQAIYLAEQNRLYSEANRPKEAQETQNAIEQVNAAIIANDAITTAKLNSLAYTKVLAYRTWLQGVTDAGQGIADALRTEEEEENAGYERRKAALEVFLADNRDQNLNDMRYRQALEAQHQAKLLDIERNKNQAERTMQIGTWQLAGELMSTLGQKSQAAAIIAIAISKALAMAQVVQQTAVARMMVMADPTVLWPAKPAAIAAVETMGAIQLGLIAATGLIQAASVGGGGSGAGGGSFGGGGGVTPGTTPIPVSQQGQAATQVTVNLNVQGHFIGTQGFVDDVIIPALRDAIDNRDFVIIGGTSRQAQNLTGS